MTTSAKSVYIKKSDHQEIKQRIVLIGKLLSGLINSIKNK